MNLTLSYFCVLGFRFVKLGMIVAALAGVAHHAQAQFHPATVQLIDNEGWWNRTSSSPDNISPFQLPGSAAFGEAFVAPDLARGLVYLSFTAKSAIPRTSPFSTINFAGWDPVTSSLTGDIYSWSGVNHVYRATDPQPFDGYFKYEFLAANTPAMTPGESYIMFVTLGDYGSALLQESKLGYIPGSDFASYTSAWRLDAPTGTGNDAVNSKWTSLAGDFVIDAGFYGVDGPIPFTPPPLPAVPEPGTYGLVAVVGLAAIGFLRRKIQRRGLKV